MSLRKTLLKSSTAKQPLKNIPAGPHLEKTLPPNVEKPILEPEPQKLLPLYNWQVAFDSQHKIQLNDHDISQFAVVYFAQCTSISKTTCVFLHGAGHTSLSWSLLVSKLRLFCNCLCIDLPFHGNSGDFGDLSIESLVSFCLAVLSSQQCSSLIQSQGLGKSLHNLSKSSQTPSNSNDLSSVTDHKSSGSPVIFPKTIQFSKPMHIHPKVLTSQSLNQSISNECSGTEKKSPTTQGTLHDDSFSEVYTSKPLQEIQVTQVMSPKETPGNQNNNTKFANFPSLIPDSSNIKSSIILVGHSMGGALTIHLSSSIQNSSNTFPHTLDGLIVLDVIEKTAIDSLPSMSHLLSQRPPFFLSPLDAVHWSIKTQMLANLESAIISIPSCLSPRYLSKPDVIQKVFAWRTNLSTSQPHWKGWFSGITQKFLSLSIPKAVFLAGTDRLDTDMMIAQMQGKYQLVFLRGVGHLLHEDAPTKISQHIQRFLSRYGFIVE